MRRWTIVLLIVVAVILVIFGGAVQLISTLLPQETQESYLVLLSCKDKTDEGST